jgi:cysteinyl-tRNA synthetase
LRLKETLDNLEFVLESAEDSSSPGDEEILKALPELETQFRDALEDDFNTPKSITVLRDLSRTANRYLEAGKNKQVLIKLHSLYRQFSDVLGLFAEAGIEEIPEEVMKLVEERESARKKKDWVISDALREKIKSFGYIVKDTKEGPNVKKAEES